MLRVGSVYSLVSDSRKQRNAKRLDPDFKCWRPHMVYTDHSEFMIVFHIRQSYAYQFDVLHQLLE